MGMTMIEKILKNHTKDEVAPGKIIWLDLDVRSARDFGGASVVKNLREHFPGGKLADSAKTFFTFDCVVPANTIAYAENQQTCRDYAAEQGIRLYDVDAGIGSHVMIEEGIAIPGATVVGTDSHLNIMGALGAFGQGMGDVDIAFAFKTGRTWFEVPRSMKIVLKGTYQYPATAKDLILFIIGKLGASGGLGYSVELYGPAIERMTLAERITVASMGTEMGTITFLMEPGDEILEYSRKRSGKAHIERISADADAHYDKVLELDVAGLAPQIALPPKPSKVSAVAEVSGKKINSVFIGSCTNGTYDDIRLAAEILKGGKVAPGVMAKVVPATKEVYGRMLSEGLLETFFSSGVIVSNPGCGGCASGQIGMTGKGEVQISTSNRNFAGKQGSGDTYLASPVTAAWCALKGEICAPGVKPVAAR
ncbi:MAG: aconitase/3-isopropylmalate dehydratase large subunit family protein [Candidatus Eremiobacteraeota bacterium]|nr:aconitase/3-isopropylmalate dehydratase large subunit family protein [Candidatus Eremiobacteraeota bacterium]